MKQFYLKIKKLKSLDLKNVKRYKVWKDTYKLEFTEKEYLKKIFKKHQIGEKINILNIDTKPIDATDKKEIKYHQFRTIFKNTICKS